MRFLDIGVWVVVVPTLERENGCMRVDEIGFEYGRSASASVSVSVSGSVSASASGGLNKSHWEFE